MTMRFYDPINSTITVVVAIRATTIITSSEANQLRLFWISYDSSSNMLHGQVRKPETGK